MSIERSIVRKLFESKGLNESEFTAGGSTYKCVFGKYYKDNEPISREDYFRAKEEGGIGGGPGGDTGSYDAEATKDNIIMSMRYGLGGSPERQGAEFTDDQNEILDKYGVMDDYDIYDMPDEDVINMWSELQSTMPNDDDDRGSPSSNYGGGRDSSPSTNKPSTSGHSSIFNDHIESMYSIADHREGLSEDEFEEYQIEEIYGQAAKMLGTDINNVVSFTDEDIDHEEWMELEDRIEKEGTELDTFDDPETETVFTSYQMKDGTRCVFSNTWGLYSYYVDKNPLSS